MDNSKIIETYDKIKTFISEEDIYINEPMSKHTTFKIGGNADIFIKVRSIEHIEKIVKLSRKINEPLKIIGNGSNILVKDNGIRGIVAKVCTNSYEFIDDETIKVDAGLLNSKVAQILLDKKLSGFEFAAGIPGTIGGAIKMNAGAYGGQMSDIVVSTRYINLSDEQLRIEQIDNEEHEFGYRHSIFSNNIIILNTTLKLNKGIKEEIQDKMDYNKQSRKEKQPIDKPSAGSTFKRGSDFITAQLIDECGLKGYTIGGAQVSEKHAGFIVNLGNATAKDVLELVEFVKKQVFEKFNKAIELEIEVIGE